MALVSITSDYGTRDPHAALVKASLWREEANLQICEISHEVKPSNLFHAAYLLQHSFRSFPPQSVHLILVAELAVRRWLVMRLEQQYFIASDSGLLSLIAPDQVPQSLTEINLAGAQSLFPGRDFLARAAAHLARGGAPSLLGKSTSEYRRLSPLRPQVSPQQGLISGSVIQVDRHGNLVTNISHALFREWEQGRSLEIMLPRNRSLTKIGEDYQSSAEGGVLAFFNSLSLLEIAFKDAGGREVNGASSLLGLEEGDDIRLRFHE